VIKFAALVIGNPELRLRHRHQRTTLIKNPDELMSRVAYLPLRKVRDMSYDYEKLQLETARRFLERLARDLELANAILDEWDQDRVATNVSACR
jgi:hypothetical protein